MSIVALLLCLFFTVNTVAKRNSVKKVNTVATEIECVDTPQCLSIAGNTWCQSGFTCIERHCHRIINVPCNLQTQICDEEKQECLSKRCESSKDCDDGIYCNGREKCINGTCQIDPHAKVPCHKGICNETTHECMHPVKLGHWRNYAENEAFIATNTTPAVIGESESRLWIGYTLGAVVILILFSFIFLLVALIRRGDGRA